MIVMQMNADIVVAHMIANYDRYLKRMIELLVDENFLHVVVEQMDHEHLLMNHVMMNDVDQYLMWIHLLMMFYIEKKETLVLIPLYRENLPHSF
jgi:hypothetical protein